MKKNVVLADNSYTIRRIVELSFSDEEGIELISFETGQDINEKLVELQPAVVLVDIKLPETNGYDVCKFINENDKLKNTKVFLIKGGFEPVDEEQLKGLKYEDFITKPFDSKALVITIKSILDVPGEAPEPTEAVEIPSSMPEEISEINELIDKSDPEYFEDFHKKTEPSGLIDNLESPESETAIRDEVLPSEEITQGSGIDDGEDKLSPEQSDEAVNPFKEDEKPSGSDAASETESLVKENIRLQEEELDISSLTMEEINIQKQIDLQKDAGVDKKTLDKVPETEDPATGPETGSLDPSLSNMDSSDLENVFSISGSGSEKGPEPEKKEETDKPGFEDTNMDSREETKEKSETIKQALEELETKDIKQDKIEDVKSVKPESEDRVSPAGKIAELTGLQNNNKIVEQVEDKLTVSVKEILWDIVPPLAEKIIKGEIDRLKKDIEKEYK